MRNGSRHIFENRFDILLFAVHTPDSFKVSDILECVTNASKWTIHRCLRDLVEIGYLEETFSFTFKATDKAKELFGVSV